MRLISYIVAGSGKVEVKHQSVGTETWETLKGQLVQAESTAQQQGNYDCISNCLALHNTFGSMHQYMRFSLKQSVEHNSTLVYTEPSTVCYTAAGIDKVQVKDQQIQIQTETIAMGPHVLVGDQTQQQGVYTMNV